MLSTTHKHVFSQRQLNVADVGVENGPHDTMLYSFVI